MVQFNPNLNVGKTVNLNQTTQAGAVDNTKPSGNAEAKPSAVYDWGDPRAQDGDYYIGADGKAHKVKVIAPGVITVAKRGKKITENFALKNGCVHTYDRTSYSWIDLIQGNYEKY